MPATFLTLYNKSMISLENSSSFYTMEIVRL
jgi:hypothetical protein